MVGPKVNLKVRGELLLASEKAKNVGDFHRRVIDVLKRRNVSVAITQRYKNGNIKNQLVLQPEGKTSVLQHFRGKPVRTHMFKEGLNKMTEDPSKTHPLDTTRKVVYDLLSSAMLTAKGEKVDGVSIDL